MEPVVLLDLVIYLAKVSSCSSRPAYCAPTGFTKDGSCSCCNRRHLDPATLYSGLIGIVAATLACQGQCSMIFDSENPSHTSNWEVLQIGQTPPRAEYSIRSALSHRCRVPALQPVMRSLSGTRYAPYSRSRCMTSELYALRPVRLNYLSVMSSLITMNGRVSRTNRQFPPDTHMPGPLEP